MRTSQYFIAGILGVIFMLFSGCEDNDRYACNDYGECVARSGGIYKTELDCQLNCTSTSGYNCMSGNCTKVSFAADYSSLSACENSCSNSSSSGYNCTSGACESVSSGATYSSLSACQNSCGSSPNLSLEGNWIASSGSIINISGSIGIYTSLSGSALDAAIKGLLSVGSQALKNISKTSTYKWNCLAIKIYTQNSIPTAAFWSTDGVLTMSNDGKSLSLFSNQTYNNVTTSNTTVLTRQ